MKSTHVLPQDRELCACTALRRLARKATLVYDDYLKAAGLKLSQYTVLARLDRLMESSLGELADACELDVTSLSRAMQPLQRDGLVEIGAGKDGRTKRYRLTSRGRKTLAHAFALWQEAQKELLSVISAQQIHKLDELSKRVG
jgi:DNA-binding MarR family transcriptional regulator